MSEERSITELVDVTQDVLDAAESVHDGWYADAGRVEWDDFIDRLEGQLDADFGDDMQSPAIRKIQAHIRKYRKL